MHRRHVGCRRYRWRLSAGRPSNRVGTEGTLILYSWRHVRVRRLAWESVVMSSRAGRHVGLRRLAGVWTVTWVRRVTGVGAPARRIHGAW